MVWSDEALGDEKDLKYFSWNGATFLRLLADVTYFRATFSFQSPWLALMHSCSLSWRHILWSHSLEGNQDMTLRTDSLLNLSSRIETRIAREDFASAPPMVLMGVIQVDDKCARPCCHVTICEDMVWSDKARETSTT